MFDVLKNYESQLLQRTQWGKFTTCDKGPNGSMGGRVRPGHPGPRGPPTECVYDPPVPDANERTTLDINLGLIGLPGFPGHKGKVGDTPTICPRHYSKIQADRGCP